MILLEMLLETGIIDIILMAYSISYTKKALFMVISTKYIQFIASEKVLFTKLTFRVTRESTFIVLDKLLIPFFVMLYQLLRGIQGVFKGKYFFMIYAKITDFIVSENRIKKNHDLYQKLRLCSFLT